MDQNITFNGQQQPQYYPQQQPPYQNYQQGQVTTNIVSTPATAPWTQPQTGPDVQWQTASNSAATTTTITTTTTKAIRERQRGTPLHATFSTTSDSTFLMQPPPQQQQQRTIQYSQQTTTQQQQQLTPQPTIGYAQLMQSVPQHTQQMQQTPDFLQLMQATPQPQPQPQPQISVSATPPVVNTPQEVSSHLRGPKSSKSAGGKASSSRTKKSKTDTTTTRTQAVSGGASRQQAAAQGQSELRRFDRQVSERLRDLTGSICPAGFDYYATRQGYLCGGGHHFFSNKQVERMLNGDIHPQLEDVNRDSSYAGGFGCGKHLLEYTGHEIFRAVTPPPGNGNGSGQEPAFWDAQTQCEAAGMLPIARLEELMKFLREQRRRGKEYVPGGRSPSG